MDQGNNDFYRYWGKSSKKPDFQSEPYHLLTWHSLDVAACGYIMAKQNLYGLADILAELDLEGDEAANWIAWLFACHDIGKFARGFQQLAAHPDSPLVPPVCGTLYAARHDSLGYWLWGKIFLAWCDGKTTIFPDILSEDRESFGWALDIWIEISTGHHGQPPDKNANGCTLAFTREDITAASHFVSALNELFNIQKIPEQWLEKSWQKN